MKLRMPSLFDVFFPIFPYLQEKEKIVYSTLYCYGMFGYVKRKLKEKKIVSFSCITRPLLSILCF